MRCSTLTCGKAASKAHSDQQISHCVPSKLVLLKLYPIGRPSVVRSRRGRTTALAVWQAKRKENTHDVHWHCCNQISYEPCNAYRRHHNIADDYCNAEVSKPDFNCGEQGLGFGWHASHFKNVLQIFHLYCCPPLLLSSREPLSLGCQPLQIKDLGLGSQLFLI